MTDWRFFRLSHVPSYRAWDRGLEMKWLPDHGTQASQHYVAGRRTLMQGDVLSEPNPEAIIEPTFGLQVIAHSKP
jgi:hypothetical protein